MKTAKPLSVIFYLPLFVFIISCKKPKSGDYTYTETGTEKIYLSESSGPYSKTSETSINTSAKSTLKNKSNSTLYVDNVAWKITGDSVINMNTSSKIDSPNSSSTDYYNYRGLISSKKDITGFFIRIRTTHSYLNTTIDSARGTFTYHKK